MQLNLRFAEDKLQDWAKVIVLHRWFFGLVDPLRRSNHPNARWHFLPKSYIEKQLSPWEMIANHFWPRPSLHLHDLQGDCTHRGAIPQ